LARARSQRILLVDDDDDSREALRRVLESTGHQVFEAENGRRAVEVAARVRPNIALIDISLPDLDGYEVARQIRAGAEDQAMRLIAVTGFGGPDDRAQARGAGFDAHVVKPLDLDRLDDLLSGAGGGR
jgi:CheY-like chemotaxis protein